MESGRVGSCRVGSCRVGSCAAAKRAAQANRTLSARQRGNLNRSGEASTQVIGETTGGGAHPTRPFPISAAVHIAIPFARSVNPVTGTNWQGTGVVPDVAVPEAEAYDVAYAKALRHVLALDDLFPPIEHEAEQALAALPATATVIAEAAVAASSRTAEDGAMLAMVKSRAVIVGRQPSGSVTALI